MAAIQRRLDVYEEFIRAWEHKLKKWEIMIEEQEQVESASDSEGREGEVRREVIKKSSMKRKSDKHDSGDGDSKSSSESNSGNSNSDTNSDSDADDEDNTVKQVDESKEVQHPESSNAAEAKQDKVQKQPQPQKSTKDVSEKEMDIGEQGRSLEKTTQEVGKTASIATQNEQPVTYTSKVVEKAPTKEVCIFMSCS